MQRTLMLVPAALALATIAICVPAASATTAPTLTVSIKVTMSETGVKLSQKTSYRGWEAKFVINNVGKKPHKFEIGGLTTPVLAPGKRHVLKVELALRGRVTYRDRLNPGPSSRGYFKVI
jgi:hypothetical protein